MKHLVYDIEVKYVFLEGEWLYQATCKQYPDLAAYEESMRTAMIILADAIETTQSF